LLLFPRMAGVEVDDGAAEDICDAGACVGVADGVLYDVTITTIGPILVSDGADACKVTTEVNKTVDGFSGGPETTTTAVDGCGFGAVTTEVNGAGGGGATTTALLDGTGAALLGGAAGAVLEGAADAIIGGAAGAVLETAAAGGGCEVEGDNTAEDTEAATACETEDRTDCAEADDAAAMADAVDATGPADVVPTLIAVAMVIRVV